MQGRVWIRSSLMLLAADWLAELERCGRREGHGSKGQFTADRPPRPLCVLALRPRHRRPEAVERLLARLRCAPAWRCDNDQ
eukprot:scaffold180447_cov34-Tisochrysis_lutea.AAC.2